LDRVPGRWCSQKPFRNSDGGRFRRRRAAAQELAKR
jgi:hypothetical protein